MEMYYRHHHIIIISIMVIFITRYWRRSFIRRGGEEIITFGEVLRGNRHFLSGPDPYDGIYPSQQPFHPFFKKNKLAIGEMKWPGAQSLSPKDNRLAYTSTLKDCVHIIYYVLSTEQGT